MTISKPGLRPESPNFSSGPCAKRPGWSPEALKNAPLGRSHRAKVGKARLERAIDLTREILQVPAGYRIGIVPASDTGAGAILRAPARLIEEHLDEVRPRFCGLHRSSPPRIG